MMKFSDLEKLSFADGKVWAIGDTPSGVLILTGIEKRAHGKVPMAKIAGTESKPVPLESFLKFQVPIEFYDEPKEEDE